MKIQEGMTVAFNFSTVRYNKKSEPTRVRSVQVMKINSQVLRNERGSLRTNAEIIKILKDIQHDLRAESFHIQ